MTTSVAGVVLDAADTPSQLDDPATVNGMAELPVRLMDWLAGLAPPLCPVNVKLVGVALSVGLLETTRLTLIMSGEFEAPVLAIEIVAE